MAIPGARRHFWRASEALAEAEGLTKLASIEGPADQPPEKGQEEGFVSDFHKRAKSVLDRAREWVDSGKANLKSRARRAAQRVRAGVREIFSAGPVSKAAADALKSLGAAADALSFGAVAGGTLTTALLLYVAYRVFVKKG